MRYMIMAVMLIALMVSGCWDGLNIPSTPTMQDIESQEAVLGCLGDARKESNPAIITLMHRQVEYGEVSYLGIAIKPSLRHEAGSGSDFIEISATDNIRLIDAVQSQFLPLHIEDKAMWLRREQIFSVPLTPDRRALIRFEYLEDGDEDAYITVKHLFNVNGIFENSFINNILIYDGEVRSILHTGDCHPDNWDSIPDDGSDDFYAALPELHFTDEEREQLKSARQNGNFTETLLGIFTDEENERLVTARATGGGTRYIEVLEEILKERQKKHANDE